MDNKQWIGRPMVSGKTGARMQLPPCPASPNCVTSQGADDAHWIEPFGYTGSPADGRRALLGALESMPRTRVVFKTPNYVRAEFRSAVLKFVDIGEFVIREHASIIDLRSASQTGYYDFGANRRRIETLRRRFNQRMKR